jgi:ring-1,2-phenylacetyl-CoA epoxidase subunit PaaE
LLQNPEKKSNLWQECERLCNFAKKLCMSHFYSLEVSEVTPLTPNAVAISFAVPEDLKSEFKFKAGQYLTIKHPSDEGEIRRSYSLCSSVGDANITVGIKKVDGGVFSVYANKAIKPGDILEVMPPEGRFVLEPKGQKTRIMAFAAGSGITPIMSIIRTALENHPESQVVLVYGNQSKEETMFFENLEALQKNYTDRLKIHYLFSRNKEDEGRFGRIDKSIVNYITRNQHGDFAADGYFLCGPEPMIEAVSETLQENGIPKEKIHYELFTPSEAEGDTSGIPEGMTHLEVTLDDSVHTLEMDRKTLVLDAVLKAKIDAPYSCQGGVCSTCIARVTEGSAKMEKNQILTDSELEEGFILTCQSHPITTILKIDYDDV